MMLGVGMIKEILLCSSRPSHHPTTSHHMIPQHNTSHNITPNQTTSLDITRYDITKLLASSQLAAKPSVLVQSQSVTLPCPDINTVTRKSRLTLTLTDFNPIMMYFTPLHFQLTDAAFCSIISHYTSISTFISSFSHAYIIHNVYTLVIHKL